MIRTIAGLALAGIALTPFAEKASLPASAPMQQSAADTINTSSMKSASRLVYAAAAPSGAHCRIMVDAAEDGWFPAHADQDCAQVYPGLEKVAGWSPVSDQSVRLVDVAGVTVVEIGVSDGFAYEAVSPSAAQFTISETEG